MAVFLNDRDGIRGLPGIQASALALTAAEFVVQNQRVQVDLELSHLPLNIAGTTFDCATWAGKLRDSRLKVKLLHHNRRNVRSPGLPPGQGDRPT